MGEKGLKGLISSWMKSSLPFMGMVLAVTALATNMIVSKIAMSYGTSFFILSVYSNALATLLFFPSAFLFQRSKRASVTFPIICRIFLLAFFGCLADISSYAGINYSSPVFGTELLNLVPGFTCVLAIIFWMEELHLKKSSGISESLGTIISIVGASIVTLYGPAILNKVITLNSSALLQLPAQNWILGGTLLATAAFSTAAWSIVQTSILKMYPEKMRIMGIYCLFVTMQSTLVAVIVEKDLSSWKLQPEMGLFAVFYAGIINIMFRLCMMSWCLSKTGPLFVSLFNPLTIVISVVIGFIFLHEVLHFRSVVGAVVLFIGLYAIIWDNAQEIKTKNGKGASNVESTGHDQAPLLQDGIVED